MRRFSLLLVVLIGLVLAGCAPRVTQTTNIFRAAFSERGVVWTVGGAAYLASAPGFGTQKVRTPVPAADVAWHGGDAWVALPSVGWVQRVTGTGGVVQAGVVVGLSSARIYREDGSALDYSGQSAGGLRGPPEAAVTGGDGQDYALQGGRLYRVGAERTLVNERAGSGYLVATPDGAAVFPVPTAVSRDFTYRLLPGKLQRVDPAGGVRAEVAHGPGLLGLVGDEVVTLSPQGQLRVFRYDLTEVK